MRDSLSWSKYINEAIELFGSGSDVMFASHHWPRWGREDIRAYMERQRDLYRWMHDQTLRLANQGWTAPEIAEQLSLPPEFLADGSTRGYYGDLVHNSKAVYQRYLSWYDGNPARLRAYPPVEAGRRYVEFMGGADAVLAKAQAAFDAGDYRWVAEVVNHLVFADPTNTAARELQARALEQLGYQAESSTFRNAYLMGAQELRQGPPQPRAASRRGLIEALTIEQCFDVIAVRLRSEDVGGQRVLVNWRFTDIGDAPGEDWVLILSNRALSSVKGRHDPAAGITVTTTKTVFVDVITGGSTFVEQVTAGAVAIDGDPDALRAIFGNLDAFPTAFPIVEP